MPVTVKQNQMCVVRSHKRSNCLEPLRMTEQMLKCHKTVIHGTQTRAMTHWSLQIQSLFGSIIVCVCSYPYLSDQAFKVKCLSNLPLIKESCNSPPKTCSPSSGEAHKITPGQQDVTNVCPRSESEDDTNETCHQGEVQRYAHKLPRLWLVKGHLVRQYV